MCCERERACPLIVIMHFGYNDHVQFVLDEKSRNIKDFRGKDRFAFTPPLLKSHSTEARSVYSLWIFFRSFLKFFAHREGDMVSQWLGIDNDN